MFSMYVTSVDAEENFVYSITAFIVATGVLSAMQQLLILFFCILRWFFITINYLLRGSLIQMKHF